MLLLCPIQVKDYEGRMEGLGRNGYGMVTMIIAKGGLACVRVMQCSECVALWFTDTGRCDSAMRQTIVRLQTPWACKFEYALSSEYERTNDDDTMRFTCSPEYSWEQFVKVTMRIWITDKLSIYRLQP